MAWPVDAGKRAAQARTRCAACERMIRPCNLMRHVKANHPDYVTWVRVQFEEEESDRRNNQ